MDPEKSGPVRCDVCEVSVNSEMQLVQHRTGRIHLRKLKADLPSQKAEGKAFRKGDDLDPISKAVVNNALGKLPTKRKAQPACGAGEKSGSTSSNENATCNACNLSFNSELQAAQHFEGSRHAKKVRLQEAAERIMETEMENLTETDTNGEKVLPSRGDGNDDDDDDGDEDNIEKKLGLFFCSYCNISVNSLQQLDAHKTGSKHKAKVIRTAKLLAEEKEEEAREQREREREEQSDDNGE